MKCNKTEIRDVHFNWLILDIRRNVGSDGRGGGGKGVRGVVVVKSGLKEPS